MTPTLNHLRDVFDDMSARAPDNHQRMAQLERRIRRDRRRRAAGAVLAGAAVITAAAVTVPGLLSPGTATPQTSVAAQPAAEEELPERFTSEDGSGYRRLAATTLHKGERVTTLTVPVTGKPLEVAAMCPKGDPTVLARPKAMVDGEFVGTRFNQCLTKEDMGMVLEALDVPEGARQVTVTFDATDEICARGESAQCPDRPTRRPADWPLAIYEYTPPAQPVEPPPIEDFPAALGSQKLVGQVTGVWPQETTFSRTFTSLGGRFRIEHRCTGSFADRITISYSIGDKSYKGAWVCDDNPLDASNVLLWSPTIPAGTKVTITGKVQMTGGHPNRQTRWAVGVYSEMIIKLPR
ncbi:hypothetical protein [Nonomuraea sp. NPDC049309]|uniref:hypothetical protein n=1 Tax=Nonomuraea sp. NPDC049309 TaxID=3364350 RepID=UPI00371EEEFA